MASPMNMIMAATQAAGLATPTVSFTPSGTQTASASGTSSASATFTLQADGDYSINAVGDSGDWVNSKDNLDGNDFEVRATKVSGDNLDSGIGTWFSLNNNIIYELSNSTVNTTKTGTYDIQIREKADTSNTATIRVVFTAQVTASTLNIVQFDPSGTQTIASSDSLAPLANFSLETNGTWNTTPVSVTGDWVASASGLNSANYEVRATKISGADPTSGTLSTWQDLNVARTWQMTNAVDSTIRVGTFDIEIRQKTVTSNNATLRIILSAENTAGF
jgi:hypothetical protein